MSTQKGESNKGEQQRGVWNGSSTTVLIVVVPFRVRNRAGFVFDNVPVCPGQDSAVFQSRSTYVLL